MNRSHTLQTWIGEALVDGDKEGRLQMLSLVHMRGIDETEVHTIRFGPGKTWTPAELSKLFRGKAENYAAEIPGTQTFCLLAFYGDSHEPQARKPLMVSGASEQSGLSTEGPTKEGLTQQAMRHSEAVLQMCFRQMAVLLENTQQMMHNLSEQNAQIMAENRDAFQIVKQVTLEKIQDQHQHNMALATHSRNMELQQTVMRLAPALVNRVTGREIFPQATEDSAIIEKLVDVLDEEKIMKIMATGAIPEEVWGLLAARMEAVMKKRNAMAAQAQAEMGDDEEDEEDEEDDNQDD